jgi:NADH-quinone oxidoreductase subunit C
MQDLKAQLVEEFGENNIVEAFGELTVTVTATDIIKSCLTLRDTFFFDTLIDLCGVVYLTYGQSASYQSAAAQIPVTVSIIGCASSTNAFTRSR